MIVAALQQRRQLDGVDVTAVGETLIERFARAPVTDRANGGHSGATLEGMQVAQQRREGHLIGGIGKPAIQRLACAP